MYTKAFRRIGVLLIIIAIVGMQIIPTASLAVNEIKQSIATSENNVTFNATFEGAYSTEADINEKPTLTLEISVSQTGYLQDVYVTVENANYNIVEKEIQEDEVSYIKKIENNTVYLNNIDAGTTATIELEVEANKEEVTSLANFNSESSIVLHATYINKDGNEKNISKELKENVVWTANAEEEISQELIRYLQYDDDKTMVSIKVNDGIKDNLVPTAQKQIEISIPTVNGVNPTNVSVAGENINYTTEDGKVTITKNINSNSMDWDSTDENVITYVYDTKASNSSAPLVSEAKATVTTATGSTISKTSKERFATEAEVGQLLEMMSTAPEKISKGYMYTASSSTTKTTTTTSDGTTTTTTTTTTTGSGNDTKTSTTTTSSSSSYTTPFETDYSINIGYADLTDKISLKEIKNALANSSEADVSTNSVKSKKVTVSSEDIISTLGSDGTITVKNSSGDEIAKLDASKSEAEVDETNIVIETSKPVNAGNIQIKVEKEIENTGLEKSAVRDLSEILSSVELSGYKDGLVVSQGNTTIKIPLEEPTSKASLDMNKDTLSTIVNNDDVIFNVELKTDDISDALYKDPQLDIVLPSEVKNIEVKSAEILYDNEITNGNVSVDGNKVTIKLEGEQTEYSKSATTNGAVVRIEGNVELDELAPSSDEQVQLTYTNAATGETKTTQKDIKIVAPTGFVTTNKITVDGQSATALEEDKTDIEMAMGNAEKTMKISGTIVNNLGEDAEGVAIVGRIPFEGNTDLTGQNLGTTVDTTLSTAVSVSGLDGAKVLYSDNGNEEVDGSGWTETPTTATKSFKIETANAVADKTKATFDYEVSVPANLDYEEAANSVYGIYYDNNSTDGTAKNLVQSKVVGAGTMAKPALEMAVKAYNANTNEELKENSEIREGQNLTYKFELSNTKPVELNNVTLKVQMPEGVTIKTGETTKTYGTIAKNSTETYEITAQVDKFDNDEESKELKMTAAATAENITDAITGEITLKAIGGTMIVSMRSAAQAGTAHEKGTLINYTVSVQSANSNAHSNVKVKVYLPKGTEYAGSDYDYDSRNNVVSTTYETVTSTPKRMSIYARITDEVEKLTAYATATSNEATEEVKSNTIEVLGAMKKSGITATQTIDLNASNIKDTDIPEFTVEVKNPTESDIQFKITDTFNSPLYFKAYSITGDVVTTDLNSSYINEDVTLRANGTATIKIKAGIYSQPEGTTTTVIHAPKITIKDEELSVNEIVLNIQGTGTTLTPTSNGSTPTQASVADGSMKISGVAWIDENNDGVQDNNETTIDGLEVLLYNAKTQAMATDKNGNEIKTTTANGGRYEFSGLYKGSYNVIIKYDTTKYAPSPYRVSGVNESSNNDFVEAHLGETEVAGCDTITLTNTNYYNINLGLSLRNTFDLKLDKVITRMTAARQNGESRVYSYDANLAKIELSNSNIEEITVLVEYTIRITNQGHVAGYAKSIVDYLPSGMNFAGEQNPDWYLSNGNAYTTSLANTIINPGETKEIKLVLTRKMTSDNTGTVRNTAEIAESYNEYGLKDINSTAGNKQDDENDMSSAIAVIAIATGRTAAQVTGIMLGAIALVSLAVYEMKKNVINKSYTNIL